MGKMILPGNFVLQRVQPPLRHEPNRPLGLGRRVGVDVVDERRVVVHFVISDGTVSLNIRMISIKISRTFPAR